MNKEVEVLVKAPYHSGMIGCCAVEILKLLPICEQHHFIATLTVCLL